MWENKCRIFGSGSPWKNSKVIWLGTKGSCVDSVWFNCRSSPNYPFPAAHPCFPQHMSNVTTANCMSQHSPSRYITHHKSHVFCFLSLQDSVPAQSRRSVPHGSGGSPMDSKQMLNMQHHQPTRLYNSSESALPAQLGGLHITPAHRYDQGWACSLLLFLQAKVQGVPRGCGAPGAAEIMEC